MDQIKEKLGEELESEIDELSEMDAGSDAKAKAIDGIAKLYRLKIDEIEAEAKRNEIRERLELEKKAKDEERELKVIQRADANKDRWINIAVQVGLAVAGWVAYDIWYRRGLKFEETGTVTSPWMRNLMSKMQPRK